MKKLVKSAVDEVRVCLQNCGETIADAFENADSKMVGARTVNGVMEAKKQLLIDILENVPLQSDACYFCVVKDSIVGEHCGTCYYGKKHGICYGSGDDNQSTFAKIDNALEDLMSLINGTYW